VILMFLWARYKATPRLWENFHISCAVVHYSTICFRISVWNSCQVHLEMDTEYVDCDIRDRMYNYCLSVKRTQTSNFLLRSKIIRHYYRSHYHCVVLEV
jgi:hypothetical protein